MSTGLEQMRADAAELVELYARQQRRVVDLTAMRGPIYVNLTPQQIARCVYEVMQEQADGLTLFDGAVETFHRTHFPDRERVVVEGYAVSVSTVDGTDVETVLDLFDAYHEPCPDWCERDDHEPEVEPNHWRNFGIFTVEGGQVARTVDGMLDPGPVPVEQGAAWLRQIAADALAAAEWIEGQRRG